MLCYDFNKRISIEELKNEYQTVTMTKIEMNQENFHFEHEKHPAKNTFKKEPISTKVSMN